MGVDTGYAQVEERYGDYVNFTDAMNREIIKISGLAAGNYTLAFDGVSLGEYTAADLAEGVNIATNRRNPGQIAAKEIIDGYMTQLYNIQRVRIFEIVENNLKNAGMFYGKTIEEMMEWVEENETLYKSNFKTYYPIRAEIINKVTKLEKESYEKAKPATHNVTITLVK